MCHTSGGGKGWDKGNLTVQGLLTGGPFFDGQNWWQLTTFEGFSQKHFPVSFFLPPLKFCHSVQHALTKMEKNQIKQAG